MPELTHDQVRDKFLKHIKGIVHYWANTPLKENDTIQYRCEGVAFSILSMLDGCSNGMPSFIVAPCPHPEDKQFHIDEDGDNAKWFPENHESDVNCDISGGLHELFHQA